MAASLRDVAERAGVSPRTVSNVVRDHVHVRPETRERVERAIEELRYRPNASARSLRRGRTGIIALAVPQIAAPYFAELADLVQQEAVQRGLTLLVDQTGADRDREILVLEGYRSHVIDGLLFSPMAVAASDLRGKQLDQPTVLLGERIDHGGLLHVAVDNAAAAHEATAHLVGAGRRRIAAVGADPSGAGAGPARRRLDGYLAALAAGGLETSPELVVATNGWSRATGYAAVDSLLRGGVAFDAVFCFNDVMALAAMRAIADHGRRVPDDIAVVGWDDVEEASYAVPSLTTVRPDKAAIARLAVEGLVARIEGRASGEEEVVCDHRLMVRDSTTGVDRDGGPATPGERCA